MCYTVPVVYNGAERCTMMQSGVLNNEAQWCAMVYSGVHWCTVVYNGTQWCKNMVNGCLI